MKIHTLILALIFSLTTGICFSNSRVEFKNNRLKVDGKPFFIYGCWGTPNKDYMEFKRRHFNTAFMGVRESVNNGQRAADAGLMVIPYPYAPGWNDKMKAAVQSVADKDWVLSWNIGDDLQEQEDLEAALKVQKEIQAIDPQNRPVMLDAIYNYKEFGKVPDMWCAYTYPLVKKNSFGFNGGWLSGLKGYTEWLTQKRMHAGPDGFFWTWAQGHVQIWYCIKYLDGTQKVRWKPSLFPDGDHLRLIAAHAISAGCRGLMWFMDRYFQADHFGRDRYARGAVIGCELDIVGQFIANGKIGPRLKTSDPSVWATPIDFPGGRLICLLKTGDSYHFQPDSAIAEEVKIDIGVEGKIYQIGFEFKELPGQICSFDMSSWLLVSNDSLLVSQAQKRHRGVLSDMARFAVEELKARIMKVKPVLVRLGIGDEAKNRAYEKLMNATKCLSENCWMKAGILAEEGIKIIRTDQYRIWHEIWVNEGGLSNGFTLTDFYILPEIKRYITALKTGSWSQNFLKDGSWESEIRRHWTGVSSDKLGGLTKKAGRKGGQALQLKSESPVIYDGEPRDRVTASVISNKIAAKEGQLWEISAWVNVPRTFQRTERGVSIALIAYGDDGNRIYRYSSLNFEVTHLTATKGWKQIRLLAPLRYAQVNYIAARLSICGVGEAIFDDVVVRRLNGSHRLTQTDTDKK